MSNNLEKVYKKYLSHIKGHNTKETYKPKISFFTGSGISVDSGLSTYRMADGLWNNYKISEVATSHAIKTNIDYVNNFFNDRRLDVKNAFPNIAHTFIKDMEKYFDVNIITQNIDDLHERSGNSNVIHLHGEIMKSRSIASSRFVYDQLDDIKITDRCIKTKSKLRPHVVLFGENIFDYYIARKHLRESEIIIIIGTSLMVNPAASLISDLLYNKKIYVLDPHMEKFNISNCHFISKTSSDGIVDLENFLLKDLIELKNKHF